MKEVKEKKKTIYRLSVLIYQGILILNKISLYQF